MRHLKLNTFLLSVILLITSCSTMDTAAVKEVDNVAVGLVGVEKHLEYGEDFAIGQLVQRLAQNEKFDLQPIAEDLHEKTFGIYTKLMPFELIPEDQVIQTDRYKTFTLFDSDLSESNFKRGSNIVTVKNYKKYSPTVMNTGHRSKMFEAMPDEAEAMLLVELRYKLIQDSNLFQKAMPGVDHARIEAKLNMELVKPNGEKIMNINKKEKSENSVKVVLNTGILQPDKIQPLVVEATDLVMGKAEDFVRENLAD